jgi:hypothetical protein
MKVIIVEFNQPKTVWQFPQGKNSRKYIFEHLQGGIVYISNSIDGSNAIPFLYQGEIKEFTTLDREEIQFLTAEFTNPPCKIRIIQW